MASAGRGDIECRMLAVLHADSPLLRLRLQVANLAVDHRLRARFAIGAGEDALAGAAFGTELRPPGSPGVAGGAIEHPVFTAPAHRFVAAADQSRGLAILAPGFFEYEWTADQDFAITLLRSVGVLSLSELPERPGHAGWPQPTPDAQEPGTHVIHLAVTPVGEEALARPDLVQELWEAAFLPVQSRFYRRYCGPSDSPPRVGWKLEGEGLVLSAVKPADTGPGLILRCCNLTGTATAGRWISTEALTGAWLVQADETLPEELSLEDDGRAIRFAVGPHQIITLKVALH
jgi:alpha-mannosidase